MNKKYLKIIIIGILILFGGFCFYYANDYYASEKIAAEYLEGTEEVAVTQLEDGLFLDGEGTEYALIFYPGAKVEYTAYLPVLMELARQGVDVFLVKMPCNLAILGINKAETIMEDYGYAKWYLGGHSLGGAMAASYASEHLEELDGLVLLAAYPTKSLHGDDFSVISIYGSEDQVLNMEKVEEGLQYMPEAYTEICIQGGNHAQFGNYGMQEGDGTASISVQEQQTDTVEAILSMIERKKG